MQDDDASTTPVTRRRELAAPGHIASGVSVRPATHADSDTLWSMLEPVFRAGDTYAIESDIGREDALTYWCGGNHTVFLAEDRAPGGSPFTLTQVSSGGAAEGCGGQTAPLGTYYICPNQRGGGGHVCNCGFVTAQQAHGRGVARAMLAHALDTARGMGYRAMQFNFVVSTNARAVDLWRAHDFEIVGRLPGAFRHPQEGAVDALVMYRML